MRVLPKVISRLLRPRRLSLRVKVRNFYVGWFEVKTSPTFDLRVVSSPLCACGLTIPRLPASALLTLTVTVPTVTHVLSLPNNSARVTT